MMTRRRWLFGSLAAVVAAATSVPALSWPWECAWRNTRDIRALWVYRKGMGASRGPCLGVFLGPYPHRRTMWGVLSWRDMGRQRFPFGIGWWDGAFRIQRAEWKSATGRA